MPHAAMSANNVAVITGGASGIGLAAAMRFAGLGMKVCIADIGAGRLAEAATKLSSVAKGGDADVMTAEVDVSRFEQVAALAAAVEKRFGGTDILMNNAGIGPDSNSFGPLENWQRILAVNLWGIIHGTQAFAPHMIERGRAGLIINTGSKQGITTPPGNPAYNVSKAGVKAMTEALQHELRNTEGCKISAHLLIPGHVFTGLTARGRTEKPAGAWTPEQTVDFMIAQHRRRRFLHPLPRQRRAASTRRAPHAVGRRRHRRKPPGAVAVASGLCGGVREVCEGDVILSSRLKAGTTREYCVRSDLSQQALPSLREAKRRSNPFFLRAVWMDCFASLRNDEQTRLRDLATHCARGLLETLRPRWSEGAGKTGCALHPRSRVQCAQRVRTRAYRSSGEHPAFPAQWLYGL